MFRGDMLSEWSSYTNQKLNFIRSLIAKFVEVLNFLYLY